MLGSRNIPLIGPVSDSNEWYAIWVPPLCNNRSIRLAFEYIFTEDGTQRITFPSKLRVIDRKISLPIDTPTVA